MKLSLLKKIGLATVILAAGILIPMAAIAGFSPDRPTKVYHDGVAGFDHVTFDSFTGVPSYGDERVFYAVKDANDSTGYWDSKKVVPGQELLFRTYVHNNADSSLNDAAHNYAGIARNTKVKIQLPTNVNTGLQTISYISASNATPGTVAASVDITSDNPIGLEFEAGSAKAYTNAVPSGIPLSDNIVKDGALIGYDKADGNLPGCFQYAALVTIKAKVVAPKLEITKQIGIPGSGKWEKEVNAKPGDTLSYNIHFENKGNAVAHNVVLTDKLPGNVDVVPGSMKLYNPLHPTGLQLNDTALFNEGVNVSDYAVNSGGNIQFKVKVKSDLKESYTGTNTACVGADETRKDICDTAVYKVTIEGKPPVVTPPPVTPPTLPDTGMEAPLAGAAGVGGMSYAVAAYLKSKKSLAEALRNVRK